MQTAKGVAAGFLDLLSTLVVFANFMRLSGKDAAYGVSRWRR